MSELVSVYITTKNRGPLLKRAIQSVQRQGIDNIEIIISDDGSVDETPQIVATLAQADRRIKLIRSEYSRGACVARNAAIFQANGDFITGLDDDDEFTDDRIEVFLNEWRENYSFICSNIRNICDGKTWAEYGAGDEVFGVNDLYKINNAGSQVFTRTSRLKGIGGFGETVRRLQDWDTWLRLSSEWGEFLRLGLETYIMHHEITLGMERVSRKYPYEYAYQELIDRNADAFNDEVAAAARRRVKYLNFDYRIVDAYRDVLFGEYGQPIKYIPKRLIRRKHGHTVGGV
ncbi:hypothetical protein ANOBCDAF_04697 [Pleomorphomonas sp. T1.2MG-36]|uniref:glycosyltransferase n=1 Tax=Pleomorphomonas sp. T1.2MG-36 TaxID=3041167 RepID=UPI0024774FE9|nr:glycosyltransferase [Pleomorphomonas sp. T1.2MG-36]CAI9404834.1 hypothetical protein ANOBCDAF_04697 [Pleomorphomonas sp. T1.2MG-36]